MQLYMLSKIRILIKQNQAEINDLWAAFKTILPNEYNGAHLDGKKTGNDWQNSAGESVALRWGDGQPDDNNDKPQKCLQFWGGDPGKMNDQKCTDRKRDTICETIYL